MGIFVVATAIVGGVSHRAVAEVPTVQGVLVLRNGNVLSGAVQRSGDDYRIDVNGASLQVPTDQVEMFASSLGEAYEARRRECEGASADSRLELARWCLQLDLLDEAARELLDARRLAPDHPALASLERTLGQLLELKATRNVQPVSVNAADEVGAALAQPDEDIEPPLDLSDAAQVQFVRSIQPMLIRNCVTGGCHQAGAAQQLQLDRWALEGNGNAEIVRRNLSAVLREVNRDEPAASVLLRSGRVEHGRPSTGGSRPLSAHQAALLIEWLNEVAGIVLVPEVASQGEADSAEPLDETQTGATFDVVAATAFGEPTTALRPKFAPRDEFDPEIFNRRHAKRRVEDEADVLNAEANPVDLDSIPTDATESRRAMAE